MTIKQLPPLMYKKRVTYFFLLFMFYCSASLQAQNLFAGRVVTSTGNAVVNASVKLKDSATGFIRYFSLTDQGGNFLIRLPAINKQYLAECSFIGYKTQVLTFHISASNMHITRNIVLLQDTTALQEIHVYAKPPVKVSGDTTTFRTEAFKQGNESNVSDLLNNIPGFFVEKGKITYNGKTVNRVLIENDDLFGQDYSTLTQNLGPRGIEKIELIENYSDKTYLSNRLQKGKELVVNLKFDKKFLYKIIASHEMGITPDLQYYKIRQNLVSLIPRIKFVTTTHFNNTGLLGSALLGDMVGIPELAAYRKSGISFESRQRFPLSAQAQMPDIVSGVVPKDKMIFNQSQFITNNLLYKPNSKLQIRNIIQYYRDEYHQQQFRKEVYVAPATGLTVSNSQYLEKKIPYFGIANEVLYTINPGMQLIYKLSYHTNREDDSSAEIRQLLFPINSSLNIDNHDFQHQLGLSVALDSNHLIDLRVYESKVKSSQQPTINPAKLFTSLTGDSTFPYLRSFIEDDHHDQTLQAVFSAKRRKGYFSLEALYTKSTAALNSHLLLFDNSASLNVNEPALMNRSELNTTIGSVNMDLIQTIASNCIFQFTQKFERGSIRLMNMTSVNSSKDYFNYLPSAELKVKINRKQNLSFKWDVNNKLPGPYDLYSSGIIGSSMSVVKGIDQLNTGISRRSTLTYTYTNAAAGRVIAFAAMSYAIEPVLYLMNSVPGVFFSLNNKISFPADGKSWSVFGSFSKYFSGIKSQVAMDMNAIRHNGFYSVNNISGPFDFNTFYSRVRCKTLITDKLITTAGIQVGFISQSFGKGTVNQSTRDGWTLHYTAAFVYRLTDKLIWNAEYERILQTASSMTHNLNRCDLSLKYILNKEKLSFNLSAINIFAPKVFTTTGYTDLSTVTQSIDMLPSYLMLQANISF